MEELFILAISIVALSLVYAGFKAWMDSKDKARSDNLRLLEQSLHNPSIDRAMIETLVNQMNGGVSNGTSRMMRFLLGVGWLALFSGIGITVSGVISDVGDVISGGVITSIIGFGLVTYPFALRELEARRAQS